MVDTLRKCVAMLSPALRRRWLMLVPVAVLSSAVEIGAASAIFVLLGMLTDPTQTMELPWVARIVALLPGQGQQAIVVQLAGALAAYYLLKGLILLGAQYLRVRVAYRSSAHLASEMLRRYLSMPYPFHFRRNSAELIRNCTSSVGEVLGGVLAAAVAVMTDLLMSLGLLVVLVTTSPGMTVAAGGLLFIVMLAVLKLTRRAVDRLGSESHELSASMLKSLQQALGGIKEVKVLGREQYFLDEFVHHQQRLLMLGYLGIALGGVPSMIVQTVAVCGAMALLVVMTVFGEAGASTIPMAGVFGYAGLRILPMTNAIVLTINGIRGSRRAVDELYEDFVTLGSPLPADASPRDLRFTDAIVLDDVSYTYPAAPMAALSGVSLVIRRGESLGIVGHTGAGKSTLVDLILGLLPPTHGRITVDGADLAAATAPWRRRIGYVPQAVFLIDDTLRRNIALGIRDDEIDDRRLGVVIGMAQLETFVSALPDGLQARVGERGIKLSGGERQRVAIARALYHDPDVIVFDEATASLDVATEAEVTHAIDRLRGVKTLVVIAHRLSTVKHCDRLVWLKAGHVAGIGSLEALRQRDEEFRELAALASV
jgi:ABC-type multidrug transport system fused ATPase/permease subunit